MKKIKITLTNGNILEKPVLTAFKGTYGDYVVLDNESVGSMGLPVILISKMQDNKLSTIVDANEWNAIKDNLRNIIAGNQIIKVDVQDEYTGDDVYYKQLTLPVASFDALKNTYDEGNGGTTNVQAPTENVQVDQPMAPASKPTPDVAAQVAPVAPENVNPESVALNQVEPTPAPVQPMPNISSVGPIADTPVTPVAPAPEPTPMPDVTPVAPAAPENTEMPMPPMNEMAEASVTPQEPVVEPVPAPAESSSEPVDVAADKEAFLKACENMFDALVAKFNK